MFMNGAGIGMGRLTRQLLRPDRLLGRNASCEAVLGIILIPNVQCITAIPQSLPTRVMLIIAMAELLEGILVFELCVHVLINGPE